MNYRNFAEQSNAVSINAIFIEKCIKDAADEFTSTSKEKYEHKANLIDGAADMTTQEKLDAYDQNYDHYWSEKIRIIFFISIASLALLGGVAVVKNPAALKRMIRLAA